MNVQNGIDELELLSNDDWTIDQSEILSVLHEILTAMLPTEDKHFTNKYQDVVQQMTAIRGRIGDIEEKCGCKVKFKDVTIKTIADLQGRVEALESKSTYKILEGRRCAKCGCQIYPKEDSCPNCDKPEPAQSKQSSCSHVLNDAKTKCVGCGFVFVDEQPKQDEQALEDIIKDIERFQLTTDSVRVSDQPFIPNWNYRLLAQYIMERSTQSKDVVA